jgi:siroheme synthase
MATTTRNVNSAPGAVYLVGAGPGDPDLLTLKAVKVIALADVIFLDDLVNPAVLQHARADARIVPVGKRGGCRSTPQEFTERLMIAEAADGRCVVRLKGGDPFISAEEAKSARICRPPALRSWSSTVSAADSRRLRQSVFR